MDNKNYGIISYLTPLGWLYVLLTRKEKNEYTTFHLRQMFGLILLAIICEILANIFSSISFLSWIIGILPVVFWLIPFIGALNEEKKEVPFLGGLFQENFKFIQ